MFIFDPLLFGNGVVFDMVFEIYPFHDQMQNILYYLEMILDQLNIMFDV